MTAASKPFVPFGAGPLAVAALASIMALPAAPAPAQDAGACAPDLAGVTDWNGVGIAETLQADVNGRLR